MTATCAPCLAGRHIRCADKGRCPCQICGGRTASKRTTPRAARPPTPRRPRNPASTVNRSRIGRPARLRPEEEAEIRTAVLRLVEGIARRSGRGHLIDHP